MKLLQLLLFATVAMSVASCDTKPKLQGTWTSTQATDITAQMPAAATATSLITISFIDTPDVDGGHVKLSSILNITQPVRGQQGFDEDYEVSIAATASVAGQWQYRDDKDELLLRLDPESLQVDIDPNGVTYSQNILTGAQQPQIDSMTVVTADAWRTQIEKALRQDMQRFALLDDVELHDHGSVLTFETESKPELKMRMVKVE